MRLPRYLANPHPAPAAAEIRVRVLPHVYRGLEGFSVRGSDAWGRRLRIFARTREGAEEIRRAVESGDVRRQEAVVTRVLLGGG